MRHPAPRMHTPSMDTAPLSPRSISNRRADILLVAVVAGAVAVAIGGVAEDSGSLAAGSFARVNGESLPVSQLETVLARLAEQSGHTPGAAERAEVIARLVEEELLLQQGLALGMARADTRLRSQLVQEVINQAIAGNAAIPVKDADLRDFLARNTGYFRQPDTFRIERYRFGSADAATRAVAGDASALAGGERDDALPATALTESRWRDHLGSSLAARLTALPVPSLLREGEDRALRLVERIPGRLPDLDSIRPQVEAEFRRRRDEETLRRYVERLRRDARIVVAEGEHAP